jgi:regulator of nonsense transcripts 1
MAARKPKYFSQALVETGKDDVEYKVTVIPYKELTGDDMADFVDNATPLGLGAGYWKGSTSLAALALVGSLKAIVIEFPQPTRKGQADITPTIDIDSEEYQTLLVVLARTVGELFAFDLAPLVMALYLEKGLRLSNAIDVQSAFPNVNRYSVAAVLKAALGDDIKLYEKNLADAFNDATYDPDSRTAYLGPVKRGWLAFYLGSVDDAVMTYSSTTKIDTLDMSDGVGCSAFSSDH